MHLFTVWFVLFVYCCYLCFINVGVFCYLLHILCYLVVLFIYSFSAHCVFCELLVFHMSTNLFLVYSYFMAVYFCSWVSHLVVVWLCPRLCLWLLFDGHVFGYVSGILRKLCITNFTFRFSSFWRVLWWTGWVEYICFFIYNEFSFNLYFVLGFVQFCWRLFFLRNDCYMGLTLC